MDFPLMFVDLAIPHIFIKDFALQYALNFEMSGQLSPSPITPALSLSLEWEGITSYLVLDEPVSASEVSQVRFPVSHICFW